LKERELRLQLAKLEARRQSLSEEKASSSVAVKPAQASPQSVTEVTTRELQTVPKKIDATNHCNSQ
jgi:hypothetical protein